MPITTYVARFKTTSGAVRELGRLAFLASLALPAYFTTEGKSAQAHYGVEPFLLGPIGVLDGHFAWFANPLLWVLWDARRVPSRVRAIVVTIGALALASQFLFRSRIAVGSAGTYDFYASYGYYVWVASIVLVGAAVFLEKRNGSAVAA